MQNSKDEVRGIRLYKAGNRTIIEIDDAGSDLDKMILQMLSAAIGKEPQIEDLGLVPIETDEPMEDVFDRSKYLDSMVLSSGFYSGMTAQKALYMDGERALVKLYDYANKLSDSDEKEAVCAACKRYMATVIKEKRQTISDEQEIEEFIRIIAPIIDVKKMLQMFTYHDLGEFLEFADYEEKHLAFEGITESLISRGLQ